MQTLALPIPWSRWLEQSGVEAVPILIDHWDDRRLTRGATPAAGNSKGSIFQVSGAVRRLVKNLAGEELEANEQVIEEADLLAWWAKAQQTGEEAYLVGHVIAWTAKDAHQCPEAP